MQFRMFGSLIFKTADGQTKPTAAKKKWGDLKRKKEKKLICFHFKTGASEKKKKREI
jgi:hypothetical protein